MIQSVLLQVSRKVLLHASRTEEVEQVPCESLPLPVWKGLPQAPVCPPGAIRWYGDTVVAKVTQWLWTAVAEERDLLSGFPMPSCMLIMRCRRGMLGPFM